MLMPKRVKRRRVHRGRMTGKCTKGNKIAYGEYGLVALEPAWIKSNQIEAARVAMTRFVKRGGKVWIDIFPHKPVTKKPADSRMGSGSKTRQSTVRNGGYYRRSGKRSYASCGTQTSHQNEVCQKVGFKLAGN